MNSKFKDKDEEDEDEEDKEWNREEQVWMVSSIRFVH